MLRLGFLVIAFATLAACGGDGSGGDAAPGTATSSARVAFEGETLDGGRVSLAELRGKPVFVNVWASWWPICNGEAVAYARFAESHPEYEFVGLNISDDPNEARKFVRKYRWMWPSLADPNLELAGSLELYGHPAVAVLDENGVIVGRHIGAGDAATWEALADEL
jgi:peroxiredoxin